MKRSFNILMVLLLSLMVVYMSVGTSVMHCLRYDKVMVGTVPDCCLKRCLDHDSCQEHRRDVKVRKHCMDVKQVKLSPAQTFQKTNFEATPVFAGIQLGTWSLLPHPVVSDLHKVRCWNDNAPHSPPREYLSLLMILII